MEEINIAGILSDCPKGMKLYSPLYGNVIFEEIEEGLLFPIKVIDKNLDINRGLYFDRYGRVNIGHDMPSHECALFPSIDQRNWCKFKKPVVPPFDIKRTLNDTFYCISSNGEIIEKRDIGDKFEDMQWIYGDYFNTHEQAEYAAKESKKLFLSLRKEAE